MKIEKRLEAIQELTVAVATLSKTKFGPNDLPKVIAQLQNTMEVLGIAELNLDDISYEVAKNINK